MAQDKDTDQMGYKDEPNAGRPLHEDHDHVAHEERQDSQRDSGSRPVHTDDPGGSERCQQCGMTRAELPNGVCAHQSCGAPWALGQSMQPVGATRDVFREEGARSMGADVLRGSASHPMAVGPGGEKPENQQEADAMARQKNLSQPQDHSDEGEALGDDDDNRLGDDQDKSSG